MQESALVKERQEEKVTTTKDAKNRKKLTIGASMDLSRGVKDLGIAVKEATELVLKIERVRGLDIRFIPMDDMYSPEKARENILQLKNQYGVDFLLNPVGTPTFFSYLDLIKTGTLAVFFPVPGISYRRTRANAMHNCIYFRPSYEDESFLLMRYIIDKRNPKKIAFFYQNDQFGLACMEGIHKVLANSPIEVIELPYLRNDVNFDTQVETVKKMNTDYIGLLATPLAATHFLEQLGDDFIRRNKFFGVSDLGGATFQNLITKKGIDIVMTNVVPDPKASSITMVQEYRYHAEKAGIPFDTFSLEAYITTMIFVNVLRTIDENITKDAVIEAIQGIKNYNLKGLPLNFDPKTRQLSNKIWISGGESSWKEVQMPTLEELHMTSTFDH